MKRLIFSYFLIFKVLIFLWIPISLRSTQLVLDKVILEGFFHDLFENTPAGYVLHGRKPVYLCNPSNEENVCIGTPWHQNCCTTWEAISILRSFNLMKSQKEYIFHVSNNTTDVSTFQNEFLLINRDAFLRMVNENLSLFQYKMGLNLSAEVLLDKLLDENENISTLLKGQTSLLGIVLGYGTKNSMCYERGSYILKPGSVNSLLLPPYRNDEIEKYKITNILPGFGYNSVSDEIDELSNSIADPTYDYNDTSTKIAFSYLKDSSESKDLLCMYEKAQSEVEKAMRSKSFLDDILAKFNLKWKVNDQADDAFHNDQISKTLPNLVARSILEHVAEMNIDCEKDHYLEWFVSGMKEAEASSSVTELDAYNDVIVFDDYQSERSRCPRIKKNLDFANRYFKEISEQDGFTCIEPCKIYYKVIQNGNGKTVDNRTHKVAMHYVIKDIEGKVLSGSYGLEPAQTLEVSKLIPGLAHGIQGMKKNEIRDIFIHQDFAYGADSDFSGGKALSVRVETVEIESTSDEMMLPELIAVDLLRLYNGSISSKSQLEALKRKYITFCGFRTWLHYKKAAKFFSLNQILNDMDRMQQASLLDEKSRRILRRFNLFLYHSH